MNPVELLLHWGSVILAIAAAVWAIYLIPLTGKARAWGFLSAAFILLATERVSELMANLNILIGLDTSERTSDILLAVVSACLLGGVIYIRAIFLERVQARHKLEQQLDELQRFQQVSIGRELRMKELYDENQVLKARVKEQEK